MTPAHVEKIISIVTVEAPDRSSGSRQFVLGATRPAGCRPDAEDEKRRTRALQLIVRSEEPTGTLPRCAARAAALRAQHGGGADTALLIGDMVD